jgi:hypothetical protein
MPAPNAGGLYKTNGAKETRFCRGLSVPRFSGRRGHSLFRKEHYLELNWDGRNATPLA